MNPKPKTHRSKDHLAFIRRRPCAWCGSRTGVEASHHGERGMAIKASDYAAIPLCGGAKGCHTHHTLKHGLPGAHMSDTQTETWFALQALVVCGDRLAALEQMETTYTSARALGAVLQVAKAAARYHQALRDAVHDGNVPEELWTGDQGVNQSLRALRDALDGWEAL